MRIIASSSRTSCQRGGLATGATLLRIGRRHRMKWIALVLVVAVALVCVVGAQAPTSRSADGAADSIDAGRLPSGYRDWRLISVAREAGNLDDIRAVLGNDVAINAY